MSGEYQLRKDVDKIIDDIYDIDYNTLKLVRFNENSPLKNIGVHVDDEGNYIDVGTLDTILESLGLMDIDERVRELVIEGGGDLSNYYTKTEINGILSSYVTIGYANSNYALINHTHSQYVTRAEISDLDINLTTLQLVPKAENQNGVMCFDRVQKTIDELDIDLKADTMSNGYLKIEVNLIERSVNNGNSS